MDGNESNEVRVEELRERDREALGRVRMELRKLTQNLRSTEEALRGAREREEDSNQGQS